MVQTSQGALSGEVAKGARAFLGIPYAAPPLGALRWQPPGAAPRWTGTRQATVAGAACMQPKNAIAGAVMSEDCLFLNVHVPDDIAEGEKLPVMIWLHGGGFLTGSGAVYDMSHLARKGRVVVVSFNYRLGALGFFRLPASHAPSAQTTPANFGLMDQQAALRWVQSEIGHFGGDASKVTLFGQSAGGAGVCMHMVAPGSAGLFHRAIIQAGLCTPVGSPTPQSLVANADALAVALGCPASGDSGDDGGEGALRDRMACLRGKPASDITAGSANDGDVLATGLNWAPIPDGVTLPGDPRHLMREGRFRRVPVLTGSNHDEGRYFVAMGYHIKNLLPLSSRQLGEAIARASNGDAALASSLSNIYTPKAYGTRDKALGALLTDLLFSCDVLSQAEELARHTTVFHYEFNEPNTPGIFNPFMAMGAFHAVELRYLFQTRLAGPTFDLPLNKAQQRMADQMLSYWAGFAANGQPQAAGAPEWPRFSKASALSLAFQSSGIKRFSPQAFRADHHCDVLGTH